MENGKRLIFVDSEISKDGTIADLGAIYETGEQFHSAILKDFSIFVKDADFICGHNIIHHDLKYIGNSFNKEHTPYFIDTLYLSPLLFPKKPYHRKSERMCREGSIFLCN